MEVTASLEAPHPPDAVFAWVEDLTRYPSWLDIVPRAVPDGDGAWQVDLRGRLGPLSRSKRLRMIRTVHEPPRSVRFERAETDGRSHSPWVLEATVEPADAGSRLRFRLHYGGGLFGPVLEKVLTDEIEQARARLLSCLEGG